MSDLPLNTRLFTLFRVFFNCRFYYPVYFVMFSDFGLSVAQFAALNLVWAVAIVLLEIPSGALADQLGRKRLVVAAAALMVCEIAVLVVTPANTGLVFWLFVVNRILSGAAEAAASGADEALAYDSIPIENREPVWRRTLRRTMIGMSIGFVLASMAGAAVYSPDFLNAAFGTSLDKSDTLKFPLFLNLLTALAALAVALRFEEEGECDVGSPCLSAIRDSFAGTARAARWILSSPAAVSLMLIGLFFDSIIRVFYTVSSNIYRVLQLPEASWGLIGAAAALIGIVIAFVCERMSERWTAGVNFAFVTALTFSGCLSLMLAIPGWGIVLLLPMMVSMRFLQYFLSHYLNQVTPSDQRATVLSFRGVSMNLAFGGLTMAFGALAAQFDASGGADQAAELDAFERALDYWPCYFAVGAAIIFVFIRLRFGMGLTRLIDDGRTAAAGGDRTG